MVHLLDHTVFTLDDDPQARELLDALLQAYELEDDVRRLVKTAGMSPVAVDWKGPLTDVWPRVLEHAAREGRLRTLVQVVSRDENSAAYDIFKLLLTQEDPDRTSDPCAALLLGSGVPRAFIDRRELRVTLREMLGVPEGRVLIVDGDRRSGKTWTWYLLCHVLRRHGTRPYKIDLSAYAQPVEVSDIVAELEDQLGWELGQDDPFASEDARVRRVVNRAKQHMRAAARDVWLVFDGLVTTALTPQALRLVENLAEAVARGEAGDRLSIVLIAYAGQLQPSVDPYVWRTHLGPIHVADLHEFFCAIAESAGAGMPPDAADVLVDEVLRATVGDDVDRAAPLPLEKISAAAALRGRQLYQMYGGAGA
ncbi:effector-associated domain EAD1-containing protein [Streptomyces sp. NPDC005931]|uniref:effector-associated domain EAD1-containing protein n=1 Tax=Streptomyces sp. NPDC005931 TaxID=3364737 RepID=UPI0036A1FDA1